MNAWLLRVLGAVGTVLFGAMFVFTFHQPAWVEHAARDFIAAQVAAEVGAHVTAITETPLGALSKAAATELYGRNSGRIKDLKNSLRSKLDQRIASALAEIRNVDCECRTRIAALLHAGMLGSLASLEAENQRLTEFIQGRYLRVVAELRRDLRIFSATNAVACLLLLVVSFARPRAINHLAFPGALLAAAVIVSSYCYVFQQNWLLSVIYSDYFGFGYLGLLGGVFVLLLDIFLNHARLTTELGNWLLHAVGSAFSLSVC
jgi:hypothetical protein